MKERETKERIVSFGCTPGPLRDIEELAEREGLAIASFARRAVRKDVTARNRLATFVGVNIPMTIEAKPGYVRCELAFPIRGYQLLEHPDAPAVRVLAIETDDGPVALLMNKEIAETVGQALLRIAEQMLKKDDLS
jgi:hypothetical protein